jgi:phosphoribosyl 1,2-cyclic phosphodiesterase
VIGSGSSGNCTYLCGGGIAVLVDVGLSGRETSRRLEAIGVEPGTIHAVCLTHEHDDHCTALRAIGKQAPLGLFANSGTREAITRGGKGNDLDWKVFTTGLPFRIGELRFDPFSVPHDAYDPVGFVVGDGRVRVGLATDIGMATGAVRERLRGCAAIVLEANHDEQLLRDADRPWALKQRIAGRQGHLSNRQAGELLAEVAGPDLKAVFLAHLSAECNRPDLAVKTVAEVLAKAGRGDVSVKLTYPDRPSDVLDL